MGTRASWRRLMIAGIMAAVVLGGCHEAPVSSQVTYTDECQVNYPNGNQSGMEDCDDAENQASNSPGATVLQMIEEPDGSEQWVPPTGNWG